jgi:hypothetical protein
MPASVYPDRAKENAMRWIMSITVAVYLAAAPSTVRSAQTPDKFIPGCPCPSKPSACIAL